MNSNAPFEPEEFSGEITQILKNFNKGNDKALDQVMPLVYQQLRNAASWHLRGESRDHTLQPTALINEVYLRIAQNESVHFESRLQFFSFAGQLMRRILVDYGRARISQKRGGGALRVVLNEALDSAVSGIDITTLISLDEALDKLGKRDRRQSRIVELRYFCGLKFTEMAEVLDLSPTTVKREWRMAKHWLARELGPSHLTDQGADQSLQL